MSYVCLIDSTEHESIRDLSFYIIRTFKIKTKDYYKKYVNPSAGVCLCGKETRFINIDKGFGEHCSVSCSNKNIKYASRRRKTASIKIKRLKDIISESIELERKYFLTKEELKNKLVSYIDLTLKINKRYENLYFKIREDQFLYAEILYYTKFLNYKNKIILWKERVYCILNDITELPKCKYCDKTGNLTFLNLVEGYFKYCSVKCSSNSLEKKNKIEKTNLEKYGFKNAWGHVSSYSKVSQELFDLIYELLDDETKKYVYYGTLNKEYIFYRDVECSRNIRPDFTIVSKKCIIEFHGDIWHANPKIFKDDDRPNYSKSNLTSKDIWERDKVRIGIMEKEGFKVKIIWEKDYHKNKNKIINECIKFINE